MHEGPYFTYIVASRSLTLYIGTTGDLRKRVFEHKRKLHDGFSAIYNCNRLVWFQPFVDPSNAIDREKQLKGWKRAKKIALITRTNPTWIDLSETWFIGLDVAPMPGSWPGGWLAEKKCRSFDSAEVRFAQDDDINVKIRKYEPVE
jgi:putative endonuclease